MLRIHPLTLTLALTLGFAGGASFAATDLNGTGTPPKTEQSPPDGQSTSEGKSNDSNDTGSHPDAADGAAGGSNSTGEATGSGAGASGGTAEDQDSR
ncbi:hypothetical protein P0Y43_19725 [Pseudomonas entomophila]|uniref:hypothetical protein n=1 Tax=Pseudomonas entomophila TaxID=312306 RepID=UPI0023D83E4B|nr:hypothetical protein [Pseudomonas entomophila]MDF0732925.1 hypothetical protein [Pseudomonas entomophila]